MYSSIEDEGDNRRRRGRVAAAALCGALALAGVATVVHSGSARASAATLQRAFRGNPSSSEEGKGVGSGFGGSKDSPIKASDDTKSSNKMVSGLICRGRIRSLHASSPLHAPTPERSTSHVDSLHDSAVLCVRAPAAAPLTWSSSVDFNLGFASRTRRFALRRQGDVDHNSGMDAGDDDDDAWNPFSSTEAGNGTDADHVYSPTAAPSVHAPTGQPSVPPPTGTPSFVPSYAPSALPTGEPSYAPSFAPSYAPTDSAAPTGKPSYRPTYAPSLAPSAAPSLRPTYGPSTQPSFAPSHERRAPAPTVFDKIASVMPTVPAPTVPAPTSGAPTVRPTAAPSAAPTTYAPSFTPSSEPSVRHGPNQSASLGLSDDGDEDGDAVGDPGGRAPVPTPAPSTALEKAAHAAWCKTHMSKCESQGEKEDVDSDDV